MVGPAPQVLPYFCGSASRPLCDALRRDVRLEQAFLALHRGRVAHVLTPAPNPTLLIVDDDPLITDTLAYALGRDFDVLASDSRAHAVSLLRQLDQPPQLALVDLGLPPMPHRPDEGFALISELLAHSPAMKILVLSGQNDAANARHARTLGRHRVRRQAVRARRT